MAANNTWLGHGRLVRDPESRTVGEQRVVRTAVAIDRRCKLADGTWGTKPVFMKVEVWGRRGEAFEQYLKKGDPVGLSGDLAQDDYTDREGNKRNDIFLVVSDWAFMPKPRSGDAAPSSDDTRDDVDHKAF